MCVRMRSQGVTAMKGDTVVTSQTLQLWRRRQCVSLLNVAPHDHNASYPNSTTMQVIPTAPQCKLSQQHHNASYPNSTTIHSGILEIAQWKSKCYCTHHDSVGIAQSVQPLATGSTVRGSYAGGCETFRSRPDRPWGPPSLLYNGYRVFPGSKAAGAWRWPPTPHLAQRLKKEYRYTSTPFLDLRSLF